MSPAMTATAVLTCSQPVSIRKVGACLYDLMVTVYALKLAQSASKQGCRSGNAAPVYSFKRL
jgi:hypothetical protein